MKIMITGATGFAGKYTSAECERAGHTVLRQDVENVVDELCFDIRDSEATNAAVAELKPDACIHLAGITDVASGWADPAEMYSVNLLGTVNLLEAFRKNELSSRILVVSSSQVYDNVRAYDDFNEKVHFLPSNVYAISKLAADLTALSYAEKYGMCVFTARPINHIGPGQSERFVTSAFAGQLKRIAAGEQEAVMRVGNLSSRRDFLDVRDVARAYRLLIEKAEAGDYYNIAAGRSIQIKQVFDKLCLIAGVNPEVKVDKALYRPTDASPRVDVSQLKRKTGWEPEIDIEDTLRDLYKSIEP